MYIVHKAFAIKHLILTNNLPWNAPLFAMDLLPATIVVLCRFVVFLFARLGTSLAIEMRRPRRECTLPGGDRSNACTRNVLPGGSGVTVSTYCLSYSRTR